jgi:hypothetical protein
MCFVVEVLLGIVERIASVDCWKILRIGVLDFALIEVRAAEPCETGL